MIQIYGGHNAAEDAGETIPEGGLEGNYKTDVAGGIAKRKACDKIGFVGCGMDGLNGLSVKQGFGVPGMPPSQHPLFPQSSDLLWTGYFDSKLNAALAAARAEAKKLCQVAECKCGQVNIRITCVDDDAQKLSPKLCGYSEVVKCDSQK